MKGSLRQRRLREGDFSLQPETFHLTKHLELNVHLSRHLFKEQTVVSSG